MTYDELMEQFKQNPTKRERAMLLAIVKLVVMCDEMNGLHLQTIERFVPASEARDELMTTLAGGPQIWRNEVASTLQVARDAELADVAELTAEPGAVK